ncbi:hypothetical protein CRUP_033497 [Coryphaenoides rupestris]|nr:hypothetical protein CRUP_033497 [Coryphaenoides rupestris]
MLQGIVQEEKDAIATVAVVLDGVKVNKTFERQEKKKKKKKKRRSLRVYLTFLRKTVTSCLSGLYSSLAQLVHWADQLMLQGIVQEEKDAIATVAVVLDGVKELVRLAAERQDGPSPSSPNRPPSPRDIKDHHARCPADQSLPAVGHAEGEDQHSSPERSQNQSLTPYPTEESAPPKPPKPSRCSAEDSAPALPPKKRQSIPGPTHSKVAVVAPMRRETEPDKEALTVDVGEVQHCTPSPSLLSPSGTPPPLPEKKRHIHQYLQYMSAYSAPAADMLFYQRPMDLSHRYNSRQQELVTAYQLTHTHHEPPLPDRRPPDPPSRTTYLEPPLPDRQPPDPPSRTTYPEPPLPDRRPPDTPSHTYLDTPAESGVHPDLQGTEGGQTNSEEQEEQGELLLVDRQEVLERLTMKSEGEEGPGVKAASPDILLVHATLTDSPGELGLARLLRSNILVKLEERRRLIDSPSWLRPLSARGVAARPGSLLDFKSQDIAEQLTLMDSKLFYKIELPEVLLWSMEQNEERSPNLTEFTQHFNNVSFWGLILQDLTFVHLGNPDQLMTSKGSTVNFSKRWQQFNILDTLRSFQQVCYSLQPNGEIASFFNDFSDHLAEEALWELSLKLRPRNTPKANQR